MKTKIHLILVYFLITFVLASFSDPYTIKRISDLNFRYEFYITEKNIIPKSYKVYYWFKGGAIHSAKGGSGGNLLNDVFLKTYHSNQIAEKGNYKNGLKVGLWITWHPNGEIETTQKWINGLRTGMYNKYDNNGLVAESGCFKNDKKQGIWYNYVKKDSANYKNGIPTIIKPQLSKLDKLTLKLQTLKDDANKKLLFEDEKNKITAAKSTEKDLVKAQELALENEKANGKVREKEAKEDEKSERSKTKKNKKAEKEQKKIKKTIEKADKKTDVNSAAAPTKENLFNRFSNKLFGKKTTK